MGERTRMEMGQALPLSQAQPRRISLVATGGRVQARKAISATMAALITLSAALAVTLLVIILGYVIFRGLPAWNVAFFTERPLPYGEVGGRVAPALLGTLLLVAVD